MIFDLWHNWSWSLIKIILQVILPISAITGPVIATQLPWFLIAFCKLIVVSWISQLEDYVSYKVFLINDYCVYCGSKMLLLYFPASSFNQYAINVGNLDAKFLVHLWLPAVTSLCGQILCAAPGLPPYLVANSLNYTRLRWDVRLVKKCSFQIHNWLI